MKARKETRQGLRNQHTSPKPGNQRGGLLFLRCKKAKTGVGVLVEEPFQMKFLLQEQKPDGVSPNDEIACVDYGIGIGANDGNDGAHGYEIGFRNATSRSRSNCCCCCVKYDRSSAPTLPTLHQPVKKVNFISFFFNF